MISQKTARDTKKVMVEWAKEHSLTPLDVLDLLDRLGRVAGNQSFEDSVKGLIKLLNDEITGR